MNPSKEYIDAVQKSVQDDSGTSLYDLFNDPNSRVRPSGACVVGICPDGGCGTCEDARKQNE